MITSHLQSQKVKHNNSIAKKICSNSFIFFAFFLPRALDFALFAKK
ncbi:hypothetical protein SAMN05444359_1159 [Neolewinella agarilytica]|uniref:Uncharacterized protein n=1 Tax=Neolewinella agarilytica TaxID=478744 RepID=A0A1H9II49_9BACT|nr:hypothetical protein SAMN05444359_1159 [Neolewinella agarilytica]